MCKMDKPSKPSVQSHRSPEITLDSGFFHKIFGGGELAFGDDFRSHPGQSQMGGLASVTESDERELGNIIHWGQKSTYNKIRANFGV